MDANPTELDIFHMFKSDQMCKILTSFMISILIKVLHNVKLSYRSIQDTLKICTNPANLVNLSRVGENRKSLLVKTAIPDPEVQLLHNP